MQTDLAEAISVAEGFPVAGSVPQRAHNPGDLVLGDKGHGTLGAEGVTIFQDDATGWAALEHELSLIRSRKSHVYTPSMTIQQMANHWTDTQQPEWARNVCAWFNSHGRKSIDPDTPLSQVL